MASRARGDMVALKKWTTPKLLVLTRSRLEENVLAACKNGGGAGGPESFDAGCSFDSKNCKACKARGGSS